MPILGEPMRTALFCLLAGATGCATFHYVPSHQPAGCNSAPGRQGLESTRVAVWPTLDEVDLSKVDPAQCSANPCRFECLPCHGHGFAEVTVKTNWFYSLLSVVTLGIVTPVQVTYVCAGDV